mgnify:FL=1
MLLEQSSKGEIVPEHLVSYLKDLRRLPREQIGSPVLMRFLVQIAN